jgi:phage-related protein
MATLLGSMLISLGLDSGAFRTGLTQAEKDTKAFGSKMDRIGRSMSDLGAKMSVFITAPLVAFGVSSVKAASDAAELQSAFNQTFGGMATAMNSWAETTGNAMGRSTQELQKAANTFGIFFNQAAPTKEAAAGLSKQFTVLAQDLSSFYNVDPGTALEKLRSGLAGEAEPLRDFGVFLNEAAVKAKAFELGLVASGGELTEQNKIMARAALIMEATTNAQGDVARTSGGTANQARAAAAAWGELQVVIGTKLLPVITPLITKFAELVNGFSTLSPGMQTFIVGAGVAAAAIGPLLMGFGGIVSGIGALVPIFAPLVALIGAGGLGAALAAAATAAAPFVAVGVALAAGWALFGDKIGPVLTALQEKVQAVLGPKLMALFETVKTALTELWQGPFGDAIRAVIDVLGTFGAAYTSVMGEALIRIISAAVDIISGAFTNIVNVVKLVVAVLTGDWAGAWNAAKAIVQNVITTVLNVMNSLAPGAGDAVRRMVEVIRTWVVDKLNAIWDSVKAKIDAVKGWFYGLYDAVVGHSYIPDMVYLIGQNIARLDALMVQPIRGMTKAATESFRALAENGKALLDNLFPDEAKIKKLQQDLADLDALHNRPGGIDNAVWVEGRRRIEEEIAKTRETAQAAWGEASIVTPEMQQKWQEEMAALATSVTVDLGEPSKAVTLEMISNFADMAKGVEDSVKGVIGSIKKGDFLGALQGVLSIISQIGGIMNGGSSGGGLGGLGGGSSGGGIGGIIVGIASSIFGGARANGGPVSAGSAYLVGERGPELFTPRSSGMIHPNNDNGPSGGGPGNVTFVFQGPVSNPEQVRRSAAQAGAQLVRMMSAGKRGV